MSTAGEHLVTHRALLLLLFRKALLCVMKTARGLPVPAVMALMAAASFPVGWQGVYLPVYQRQSLA
jgi:hypothetical protein